MTAADTRKYQSGLLDLRMKMTQAIEAGTKFEQPIITMLEDLTILANGKPSTFHIKLMEAFILYHTQSVRPGELPYLPEEIVQLIAKDFIPSRKPWGSVPLAGALHCTPWWWNPVQCGSKRKSGMALPSSSARGCCSAPTSANRTPASPRRSTSSASPAATSWAVLQPRLHAATAGVTLAALGYAWYMLSHRTVFVFGSPAPP